MGAKMLSIDEINKLQEENRNLKAKYIEVLDLAKKNADSNEYCLSVLEKKLEDVHNTVVDLSITYPECAHICIKILDKLQEWER